MDCAPFRIVRTKWCQHCSTYKARSAFYQGKKIDAWCRSCVLSDPGRIASRRASSRRRRARMAGVITETYTSEEIAERDSWICQICRKQIGRNHAWPHPRSLSIDHIIPITAGGNDVKANVQATHLRCNTSKGTRGVDQLRLIG